MFSNFVLLFKTALAIQNAFRFIMDFRVNFFISAKNIVGEDPAQPKKGKVGILIGVALNQ